MTTVAERNELAVLMDLLVAHEPKVHYLQKRPMVSRSVTTIAQLRTKLATAAGIALDCSETVTLVCRLAGLADPNGLAYDGYGNTGTLLKHLPHYKTPASASVGALVVFGGEHVCMVRRPGLDPILFSHGSERGPLYIRCSAEATYHPAPVVFLDISHL
jgi:hypothetical protein